MLMQVEILEHFRACLSVILLAEKELMLNDHSLFHTRSSFKLVTRFKAWVYSLLLVNHKVHVAKYIKD